MTTIDKIQLVKLIREASAIRYDRAIPLGAALDIAEILIETDLVKIERGAKVQYPPRLRKTRNLP